MSIQTPKLSVSYPYGIDFEWYASDAVGHIAVFTTAGNAPIPKAVLASLAVANSLGNALRGLPPRGPATMLISVPRPNDFQCFAGRGFFAYDWQDIHRTRGFSNCYELVARPDAPIHLSELPEQFQSMPRSTALAGVRFADCLSIDVRRHFDCEPA